MKNQLFLFVGPKAIGGTYLITKLCAQYPHTFCEVRSTTTRLPRPHDDNDLTRYDFLSQAEFLERKNQGMFLEIDEYHENFYGTSWQNLNIALEQSHALMKITALGARAIAKQLGDSCVIIYLVPQDGVLRKNLSRRYQATGFIENMTVDLENAHGYLAHMQVTMEPHKIIYMSGTDGDLKQVIKIVCAYGVPI